MWILAFLVALVVLLAFALAFRRRSRPGARNR
jgi:hypothetical protein